MHVIPKCRSVAKVDSVAFDQPLSKFRLHAMQTSAVGFLPPGRGLELGGNISLGRLAEEVNFNAVIVSPEMNPVVAPRVRQSGIAGNTGYVGHLAVLSGSNLQESCKMSDISGQSLGFNFLLQVGFRMDIQLGTTSRAEVFDGPSKGSELRDADDR